MYEGVGRLSARASMVLLSCNDGGRAMEDGSSWLHHDHRRYEVALADLASLAEVEDWSAVRARFAALRKDLELHVRMENDVLYRVYEELPDAPQAPTMSLRHEHDEILVLLRDVGYVLGTLDSERVLEALAALEHAVTRHHQNEEEIFLPMAGHALLAQRDEVLRRLREYDNERASGRRS